MNPEQQIEHKNWQKVVQELRRLGIEINDQDDLNNSLREWSVSFVKLTKIYPHLLKRRNK